MSDKVSGYEFSAREQHVLKKLIDHYISDGQPVGSRTLSKLPGIDISAASVRNVMGDLEALGLLKSPHTSAGRIPTSKAYRVFVDSLLEMQAPSSETIRSVQDALKPGQNDQSLIKAASSCLSGFTQMAGMVTVPRLAEHAVRQIEFVPLSEKRVLVILIFNQQEVQNRIIAVERDYGKDELDEFARYLNAEFIGRPLKEVRDRIHTELENMREDMSQQMKMMVEVAGKVFDPETLEDKEDEMVVAGETNLMAHDVTSVDSLRGLFEAFQHKRDIYHLLERCIPADGVQIFIGRESGYDMFDDYSVVTSPYKVDGEVVGVLGVIGPKRMAYDKVIPVVDITSKLLSAALNSPK